MNIHLSILFSLTLLGAVAAESAVAQDGRPVVETAKLEIADDVRRAATTAKVEPNDRLVRAFADSAYGQSDALALVYSTVLKDDRVVRLARYLTAKAEAKASLPVTSVTADDLGDFHWGYLARDVRYSPARLESVKGAKFKLATLESSGIQYNFGAKGQPIHPGSAVLLPVAMGESAGTVTLTFDVGNRKALWTGSTDARQFSVAAASTSQGCEIHVNSVPPEATVYFNGREWHRLTNTKSVHAPGTWEVVVRLQGRKEWREQQTLGAGGSWKINAHLVKQ